MPVFFEASAKSSAILIFGKASLSTACKFKLGSGVRPLLSRTALDPGRTFLGFGQGRFCTPLMQLDFRQGHGDLRLPFI